LDLDPEVVYFYLKGSPVEWDARLREHLIQVAAAQSMALVGRPTKRKDGTVTPASISLTADWLLRPEQGRSTLGAVLRSMKPSADKRRILQSLGGTYPCNATLLKWKLTSSPACSLCGQAVETVSHVQCTCPVLREARIRAHHNLVILLWGWLQRASSRWVIHREMTVEALCGLASPPDCHNDWQRAVDELRDSDLDFGEDQAETAGLLRKRPDGFAFNWGSKTVLILEFTRAYDWRVTWHTDMDQLKRTRYTALQNKLSACLGKSWKVEVVPFTMGVRGSYCEPGWRAALGRFGIKDSQADNCLQEIVAKSLEELNELYKVRSAALQLQTDHARQV